MDICDLGNKIVTDSKHFQQVMYVCSTLLHYHPLAHEAREYLSSRVPTFNISGFTLGYFPDNNNLNLLLDKVDLEILQELGLVYLRRVSDTGVTEERPQSILSNHNIVLPYQNLYGDTIGLVGRTLLSKEDMKLNKVSKYKNSELKKSLNLFGLNLAKHNIIAKNHVIIVEGQFDCITAHRFGFNNVVALGGVSFSKYHFYLLKRYTNNIYLLLDNDEAGQRERDNILSRYGNLANIQTMQIDSRYKDIDEYLRKSTDHSSLIIT